MMYLPTIQAARGAAVSDIPPDELRELIRKGAAEGMATWLDQQWKRGTSRLGVWVLRGAAAALLAIAAKLMLLHLAAR